MCDPVDNIIGFSANVGNLTSRLEVEIDHSVTLVNQNYYKDTSILSYHFIT